MIEKMIFKGLLNCEDYARAIMPYLNEKFFSPDNKKMFNLYREYFFEYNKIPTYEILSVEINNKLKNIKQSELDNIVENLEYCLENKEELIDVAWLFKTTEEHAKAKLLENAIVKTIRLNEGDDADKEGEILSLFEEVTNLSFDDSIGMSLFDDAEARYLMYMQAEDILPFKMNNLNELFGGGGRRKSLACLVGRTNIGKSLHLCHYAADFVRMGYNVVYFSGEMSEKMTYERIDANLCNIPVSDFSNQTLDKEKYINSLNENKKTNGNLIVKEFPTKSCHVGHLKKVLQELKQKRKFKADIVIIDYLNLFLPQRKATGSDYSDVKTVAEELRGMCSEENVFGLTATQLNRSGSKNQESANETDVSDSYGISMTMDVIVGIYDNEDLVEQSIQGLSLWKTRFSKKGANTRAFVHVDWEYMRLREYSELTEAINATPVRSESVKKLTEKFDNDVNWG